MIDVAIHVFTFAVTIWLYLDLRRLRFLTKRFVQMTAGIWPQDDRYPMAWARQECAEAVGVVDPPAVKR